MTPATVFLISLVLKVTALLGAAALLTLVSRRASASVRHALWTSALASALFVTALAFVVPQWKVVTVPMDIPEEPQAQAPNLIAERPIIIEHAVRGAKRPERVTVQNFHRDVAPSATPATPPRPAPASVTPSALPLLPILAALWLAGCVVVLGRYLVNALRLHRAQRQCRTIAGGSLAERLRELQRHLGISRPVTLVESDSMDVPMTWGVVYPRVLLPKAAGEWPTPRVDAVLQHELAHVKRCDALTQWLAYFACALYWFHPLAWYAARQMRAERERACDDFVLHAGVPASAYASDLLEIVSSFSSSAKTELYPAALAMARRSQFEGRLMALLNPHVKRSSLTRRHLAIMLVLVAAVTIPLAALAARGADYRAAMGLAEDQQPPAPSNGVEGGVKGGVSDGTAGGVAAGVPGGVRGGVPTASSSSPAATASSGAGFSYHNEYGTQPVPVSYLPQAARGPVEPDLLSGCTRGKDSSSSHSTNDDGLTRRVKISWEGFDCSINMRAEGKYTFNADFTAFETVGQYVEIKADLRGERTDLSIRPGAAGLEYKFSRNGQETPFAQGGAAWLAKFLVTIDRLFAVGIDARFPRLVREGGPNRILAEVGVMGNDYARAAYMLRLVETVPLTPEQLRSTLVIDQGLSSDYEKARVLVGIAKKYDLNDVGVREAFLGTANSLQSDYEHARSLLAFFEKGATASPEQLRAILSSVTRMSSDYEKGRVLIAVASRYDLKEPGLRDAFLAGTKTLTSDYEHARSLLAFFDKGAATPEQADAILASVSRMSSDYERGRVLLKLNEGTRLDPTARLRLVTAADAMQSDYEKGRVLQAAISHQGADDQTAMAIIQSTRKMGSDHERSDVLQTLARSRSLEGNLREAFVESARAMGSEYERNKALAAVGLGPVKARTMM